MKPTDLAGLYPAPVPPECMNWRDKLESNLVGLLAWLLLVIFGCGLYFIWSLI